MNTVVNVLGNPAVQSALSMMLRDLLGSLSGKNKSNRQESLQEVEKLREEIEKLKAEKAEENGRILESKDKELINTCRRNESLQREVFKLRKTLISHQQSGKASAELQKENEEMTKAIAKLEEERQSILAMKEDKESEIAEIKKQSDAQKKEMADLAKLMSKVTMSLSGEGTSSNNEISEKDLLLKMMTLVEKAYVEPTNSKKKKKKPNSNQGADNQKVDQVPSNSSPNPGSNIPGPPNMGPTHSTVFIPNAYVGHQYPNMGQAHHTVGQHYPNMSQHYPNMSQHYPNMSQQYPNMAQQFPNMGLQYPNMNQHIPNMNQQYPNKDQRNPDTPQRYHHNNQRQTANRPQSQNVPPTRYDNNLLGRPLLMDQPQRHPLLPTPPALMDIKPSTSSTYVAPSNKPSMKPIFKPNIVKKPNNLGSKQKKTSVEKTESNEKSENPSYVNSGKSGENKSGSSKDLWSQLDELKLKIEKSDTPRKDLCGEVSTMIADAVKTNITSKEHFMDELSKCLKLINEIPDERGESTRSQGQRRGGRGKFHGGRGNYYRRFQGPRNENQFDTDAHHNEGRGRKFHGGRGYHYRKYQGPKNDQLGNNAERIENSDENNCSDADDAGSICSERSSSSRGRGGKFRGGRGYQYRKHQGPRNDRLRNDAKHNETSDENNSSDVDDAASICSERSFSGRHGRGRRDKGRGNWRGRGNFRGNYRGRCLTAAKSCEQLSTLKFGVNTTVEATDDLNSQSSVKDEPLIDDLLVVYDDDDDEEDLPSNVDDGYATAEVMELFIGSDIPTLMDAIVRKIDVTMKTKNCILISTKDDNIIQEKPASLLDIIQFKQLHPDAVCLSEI